jgi:dolichyl-phosphate-mannose--protein O-mannosyl transferase
VFEGFPVIQPFFSSAIFGTGIICLTYRLADHFYKDYWIILFSGLFLIFPGIFIDYSRLAMADIPLAFFFALAIFAFVKAKKSTFGTTALIIKAWSFRSA